MLTRMLPALARRHDAEALAGPLATAGVGLPLATDDNSHDDDDGSDNPKDKRRYRAIFLSDIHLGTRGCQADILLDFLKQTESDYLYLVGDIIDGWRLRRSWYWVQSHNDVIQKVLRKARKGTRVIYIPGNHDEAARDYVDLHFGGVAVLMDAIHTGADGRRWFVLHGDAFDGVVKYAKWLAHLGDWAYNIALTLNTWFNRLRRVFGYPYWSLSAYLKHRVKNAVDYISSFETAVAEEARRHHVEGVICGHIHHAEIREIDGITYCNDGDWVESCTALVEHADGRMEILHWAPEFEKRQTRKQRGRAQNLLPAG